MRSSPLARTKLARPVVVSLSGSGFLAAFHMGVMQAFREAEVEIDVIGGASGGALVACGQALGIEPSVMLTRLKRTAALCRKDGVRSVPLHLHAAIQETLPLDLDVTRITQLRIAVTRVWPYERTLVESFTTRDDLVAALETSCHIPFYLGGFARSFRGNPLYIDGGLGSVAPPLKGEEVITVLSFPPSWMGPMLPKHVKADLTRVIAPPLHAKPIGNPLTLMRNAIVPPTELVLQQVFELGHEEGARFIEARL